MVIAKELSIKLESLLFCGRNADPMATLSAQETSYWRAMLSNTSKSYVKCDGTSCGRSKGSSGPEICQAINTFYCPLNPALGSSQTAAGIIASSYLGRSKCETCSKIGQQRLVVNRTVWVRLPVVLPLLTFAQQVSNLAGLSCHACDPE